MQNAPTKKNKAGLDHACPELGPETLMPKVTQRTRHPQDPKAFKSLIQSFSTLNPNIQTLQYVDLKSGYIRDYIEGVERGNIGIMEEMMEATILGG